MSNAYKRWACGLLAVVLVLLAACAAVCTGSSTTAMPVPYSSATRARSIQGFTAGSSI